MLIRFINIICFIILTLSSRAQKDYVQYVNPFIGTGGHGHTYPGATLPHGMVQLSPDTRLDGWDGCGGYHYSDSFIYGFSHTHLSGTGVSDYGDILLMPMHGEPSRDNKQYGSRFSHANEKATAGYYSVLLDDDNIQAEFTCTERVGMHHYRFASPANNSIILDLKHRDEVIESSLKIEDSVTVSGLRRSKAWAQDQYVFFVMKFSRPISRSGIWQDDVLLQGISSASSKNIKAYFGFQSTNELFVKVAISPVSVEGARKNLNAELPGWDFNTIKKAAEKKWNAELSKIAVESTDENKLKIFYTALYHTAIVPNINMDVDSMYRGRDKQLHKADFTNYSVFSLWDTYRAAHPLYTIIDKKRTRDYIRTFLAQYQQGGRLPVWELAGNETDCMIGYHSVPVIVDAYTKGITDFDAGLALQAMKKSAGWDHLGLPFYRSKGMIEVEDEQESVSKTLEYAYDDFCIGLFAGLLGKTADEYEYLKRAQYYKNMLDVHTGFMRPRKNGDWLTPFDPREVNNYFTEANSWQYSFYFLQDIGGYIKLSGGKQKLGDRLDSLFGAPSQTTGRDQSDITGLIGQYAHGNEPSHHIAYLYNYTETAYKTQALVHRIMTEFYKNTPDGLIGNEDCGQMSAWYVLSALGFYPVTPGTAQYEIGTPLFPSAKINLENGRTFQINAPGVSDDNFYVANSRGTLMHSDIAAGGKIDFIMQSTPAETKVISYADMIGAATGKTKMVMNPVIHGGAVPFSKNKRVAISSQDHAGIYYTLDGTAPSSKSTKYTKPVAVNGSVILKAVAIDAAGNKSFITTAAYKKLPHNWTVRLNSPFEKQYDGGGPEGLVDRIRGTTDWRKGNWQGYQHNGVDVVIDLQKVQRISKVSAGFLQDTRAWIIMPKQFSVEVSADNKNFTEVYEGEHYLPIESLEPQLKVIDAAFPAVPARYVRIRAKQYGKLPAWHEGAGGDTHIFIDEILIE
jgi:predicted alpha-1,2-mannosidase